MRMAFSTPIQTLLLLIFISSAAAATTTTASSFIRLSCRSTRFPAVCVQSLSSFSPSIKRSPRHLALAALTISAARAKSTSTFLAHLPSARTKSKTAIPGAVDDCLQTLSDSVDRLSRSVKEMNRMGRFGSAQFNWHLSNVQTWVSAALTDQSTCLDSLAQDSRTASVRAQIKKRIDDVTHVTSNALALVNRLQD